MSYLLQFPPSQNRCNEVKPPYVWFGIQDEDVTDCLPERIPLCIVLSYIPKLKNYIMEKPDPEKFDKKFNNKLLREPHVGIMITAPRADKVGFKWVINAMLQAAGVLQPRDRILTVPKFLDLILIHRSWLAVGLPQAGLHNLDLNMYMRLLDDRILLQRSEMIAVWHNYPHDGNIVHAMMTAFFRNVINHRYKNPEISAIVYFALDTKESWQYFEKMRKTFEPAYEDAKMDALREDARESALKNGRNYDPKRHMTKRQLAAAEAAEAAEAQSSKGISSQQAKPTATSPPASPRPSIRKVESDESIGSTNTVSYSPQDSVGWYDTPEDIEEKKRAAERKNKGKEKVEEAPNVAAEIEAALERIQRRNKGDTEMMEKKRTARIERAKEIRRASFSEAAALQGSLPKDEVKPTPAWVKDPNTKRWMQTRKRIPLTESANADPLAEQVKESSPIDKGSPISEGSPTDEGSLTDKEVVGASTDNAVKEASTGNTVGEAFTENAIPRSPIISSTVSPSEKTPEATILTKEAILTEKATANSSNSETELQLRVSDRLSKQE